MPVGYVSSTQAAKDARIKAKLTEQVFSFFVYCVVTGCLVWLGGPDTTTPHRDYCMGPVGRKAGKLRIQIIVGSGA